MMLKQISAILWQRWSIFLLVVAIAIGIGSCRQIVSSSSTQNNNQLVSATIVDPKTFNPVVSSESPNIFEYVSEGLITENIKGEVEPALAESWMISPDKKTITFTLKKNLKWSNGEPLTIDDVLFTFSEVYFNPDIPSNDQDGMRIGKDRKLPTVKKIDDDRIEFTTPEPFAPFIRSLGIGILPAHKLRSIANQKDSKGNSRLLTAWGTNTNPKDLVSNGMFVLDSYTPVERLVFKKNPYYWRKDTQGKQQPYIDKVIWKIVESPDTALVQFRAGELDSFGVSPSYFSLIKQEEKKGGYTIKNGGPATGTSFMSFNLNQGERDGKPLVDPIKSKWFNNVKFRQAIAYGINRQRMINNIYRGLGATQDSPISTPSPYYLSPAKGLPVYDYNPQKAKELLTTAGFTYNQQNQLIDDDGNLVRFSLLAAGALGTQIKQDLGKIGIDIDFTPIAFSLLGDRINNSFQWDTLIMALTGGVEPNDGANVWSVNGGLHVFNMNPPQKGKSAITGHKIAAWEQKINDLYIQGAQELDEAKRRQIYGETQIVTQENLPFIYFVNPLSLAAIKNRVKGIQYSSIKSSPAFWNMYELTVSE
jgi:peptide/nickel transport system substrate-binding protein